MSKLLKQESLIKDIRHNCDISDARDYGVYSMCSMVLKLRNLYKWEKSIEPWDEPEPADLLDWIDVKENYWADIAEESFRPLGSPENVIPPFDHERINPVLENKKSFYGAGYGRSMKSIFFLGEIVEHYSIENCPILILGEEWAKEMASPFAMAQDGSIVIRKEPLRFFLWDHIQEMRSSSRSSFRHVLNSYGLQKENKLDQELLKCKLDNIVDEEMDLFIYHEVGEILQKSFDTITFQKIIGRFPSSVIEFVCRAIKDILADTHPKGPLAYLVKEEREPSLGFYLTFFDGLREKLCPEISVAWQKFLESGDWLCIEQARSDCWHKHLQLAEKVKTISLEIGEQSDDHIIAQFNRHILAPIGIEQPV